MLKFLQHLCIIGIEIEVYRTIKLVQNTTTVPKNLYKRQDPVTALLGPIKMEMSKFILTISFLAEVQGKVSSNNNAALRCNTGVSTLVRAIFGVR